MPAEAIPPHITTKKKLYCTVPPWDESRRRRRIVNEKPSCNTLPFPSPFFAFAKNRSQSPSAEIGILFREHFFATLWRGKRGKVPLISSSKEAIKNSVFFGTFDLWMSGRESKVAFSFAFYGEPKLLWHESQPLLEFPRYMDGKVTDCTLTSSPSSFGGTLSILLLFSSSSPFSARIVLVWDLTKKIIVNRILQYKFCGIT